METTKVEEKSSSLKNQTTVEEVGSTFLMHSKGIVHNSNANSKQGAWKSCICLIYTFTTINNFRSHSAEISSLVIDDEETKFRNIPNSILHIATNSYPLVITSQRFLMMLDGTSSNSYFERFGVSELARAGNFSPVGCHKLAVEIYAQGNVFCKSMSACAGGKLFDNGLGYIQHWKKQAKMERALAMRNREMEKIAVEFEERCEAAANEADQSFIVSSMGKSSELLPSSNIESLADQDCNTENKNDTNLPIGWGNFWKIFDAIHSLANESEEWRFISKAQTIKGNVETHVEFLTAARADIIQKMVDAQFQMGKTFHLIDELEQLLDIADELRQLSSTLDASESEFRNKLSTVTKLSKSLQSRRRTVEPNLNKFFHEYDNEVAVSTSKAKRNKKSKKSKKGRGRRK